MTMDRFLGGNGDKEVAQDVLDRSVIQQPPTPQAFLPAQSFATLFYVFQALDEFQPWGRGMKLREKQLREFTPTEPIFNSALGTVCARNAAFDWAIDGPPRTVQRCKDILDNADDGRGWEHFVVKVSTDLYNQDDGAFIEWVRDGDGPDAPLVGINALDAGRCYHTGHPLKPVVYQDIYNHYHLLDWWNVSPLAEMPTPIEGFYGKQMCALSRLLFSAKIMKNIMIYKYEKTGGRHNRAIHFISGITTKEIKTAVEQYREYADSTGLQRYAQPIMVGAVDPKADVKVATLELASLPDNFDDEKAMKEYIMQIALAFLSDYQDFAPLPGGNLGTSSQSQILHMKSRGKGSALFQNILGRALNQALPSVVDFGWEDMDEEAEQLQEQIRTERAKTRQVMVLNGEITAEESRQMAVDSGDIPKDIYEAGLAVGPSNADVVIPSEEVNAPTPQPPAKMPAPAAANGASDVAAKAYEGDKAQHRRDTCMSCKQQPPDAEIMWAEGKAHSWFCASCLKRWEKDNPYEINARWPVTNGMASSRRRLPMRTKARAARVRYPFRGEEART